MEHLQRVVLLLLVIVLIVSPGYLGHVQNQYYLETWTEAQAESFFEDICRQGYCAAEEYLAFCEKLYSACETTSVYIEEFQRSYGRNGTEYRNYIPWEEIKKKLESDGVYYFQNGGEIRLYLEERGYFGLVRGENGDT